MLMSGPVLMVQAKGKFLFVNFLNLTFICANLHLNAVINEIYSRHETRLFFAQDLVAYLRTTNVFFISRDYWFTFNLATITKLFILQNVSRSKFSK